MVPNQFLFLLRNADERRMTWRCIFRKHRWFRGSELRLRVCVNCGQRQEQLDGGWSNIWDRDKSRNLP